jgi:TolA-binding protein
VGALAALRSVQLERFVDEVRAFERTGKATPELDALGGGFLRRVAGVGWLEGRRLAMDEHALRAAYKLKWNATARLDAVPELALSLDETRALYAFYISHAHPAEGSRAMIDAARKNARTPADCEALDEGERIALETWRLDKVVKLATLDPAYPGAYARGVAEYRAGHYEASARALQAWIDAHPDGAYALRARNHLRAALAMSSPR